MPALVFLPAFDKQPVSDDTKISVILKNGQFQEGFAKEFNFEKPGETQVDGWREMLPDEVVHPEHRPHSKVLLCHQI